MEIDVWETYQAPVSNDVDPNCYPCMSGIYTCDEFGHISVEDWAPEEE